MTVKILILIIVLVYSVQELSKVQFDIALPERHEHVKLLDQTLNMVNISDGL